MSQLRNLLQSYLDSPSLPEHESLLALLEAGIAVLEGESSDYRPLATDKNAGGLLDFTSSLFNSLPIIIVPDLHGRGKFILDIMDFKLGGRSVLELLESGKIIVLCVGDIYERKSCERVFDR